MSHPMLLAGRNAEIVARVRRGESMSTVAREFGISRQRVDQLVNAQQANARQIVARARETGGLVAPNACQGCGAADDVAAHHSDYSRPLDVVWVCALCHSALDAVCRRRARARSKNAHLLTAAQAAERIGKDVVAFRGWVRAYGVKPAVRRPVLYHPKAIDAGVRRAERTARRTTKRCKRGHLLVPENRLRNGRGNCRACNALHANGRATSRASVYAVRMALRAIGLEDSAVARQRVAVPGIEITSGGRSPWYVRHSGAPREQWIAARTVAEVVAAVRSLTASEQEVAA